MRHSIAEQLPVWNLILPLLLTVCVTLCKSFISPHMTPGRCEEYMRFFYIQCSEQYLVAHGPQMSAFGEQLPIPPEGPPLPSADYKQ